MKLPSLLHPRSLGLSSSALLRAFIERIVEFPVHFVGVSSRFWVMFLSFSNEFLNSRPVIPCNIPGGTFPFLKGKALGTKLATSFLFISFAFRSVFQCI